MNNDNLVKFAFEYNAYPDSGKLTVDPFVVNMGKINIWFNNERVWNEDDYIASFSIRILFAIESLKEGEEIYVDHHDSSGFVKMVKTGNFLTFSLGRGNHRPVYLGTYKEVKISWNEFLKEIILATEKFLKWISDNWSPFLKTGKYQNLQDKLSELKEKYNL